MFENVEYVVWVGLVEVLNDVWVGYVGIVEEVV